MARSGHVRELGRAPVQRLLREVLLARDLASRAPRAPRRLSPWIASWGRFSYGEPDVRGWEDDPHHVHIGSFVSIARDVVILTGGNHRLDWVTTSPLRTLLRLPGAGSDGHPTSDGDVVIEDDVWIGEGAMILSGVRLGRACTVAARAVVAHDVEPNTIVGGSPARPLRERFDDHWRSQVATVDWCSWPRNVLHRYVAELSSVPSEQFLKAADTVAAVRDGKEDGRSFHSAAGLDETYEVTRSEDFTWGRTTVVVACYRHQDHVAAAIASVLAQTDRAITIVVTDDASPDSTADRARDVLQTQQRIPWLIARSRANHGLNRILNDILVTTDSPYFAFLGGDDLWEPEKLHVQHDELARHSGASAVVGDAFRLGSSPATEFERYRIPADRTELTFEDLLFDYPVAACVPLFVTSHIRLAGGWDESLSYEDQDLLLKLADVAPLPVIHRPLASHRFHPQTSSNVHATAHIESQNRLLLSWWGRTRLGDGRIVDALTFNAWRLYRASRFDEAARTCDHVLDKSPSREVAIVRELAARRIGRFSLRGRVVLRAIDWQKGPAPLNPRTWAEVDA